FILHSSKGLAELFAQGTLVAWKRGRAAGGADKVAQVDHELPAEATNCEGGGLGKERRKQHHRNRYAYENGQGRVQKCNGVVGASATAREGKSTASGMR